MAPRAIRIELENRRSFIATREWQEPLRQPPSLVRVAVIAELRLYRESLAEMLGAIPALEVTGTAGSLEAAVALVADTRPHVAVLDLRGNEGRGTVRALGRSGVQTRVVALAVRETDAEVVAWAEAGIAGFVTRNESFDELVSTVLCAARGEVRCSPRVAAALVRRLATAAVESRPARVPHLTCRESEVVRLIGGGLSNKEIALTLHIEPATAKNHVHNILEKLGARTRAEAATLARREGLVPLEDLDRPASRAAGI
jgi:two-component system nitrate/nitrite response regulator NarL